MTIRTTTLALILALTAPAYAGGPVILEDNTETVAPDRDRNGWVLPVLLGVLAVGLIANGGGDGVSVGDPVEPGPKPCVKTEGGC